jgi:23S rRNA pseudouridine1911/1915/1917 synthase
MMTDMTPPPFGILFEDYHCLAVAKPAPLLTQGVPPAPSLEAQVKVYLKEKYAKPAGVYLGVPHRLDRPVSGVVVFARNTKAAQRLAAQFQEHSVEKVYWALVQSEPPGDEGVWEDYLRKLPAEARSEVVAADALGAKLAMTAWRKLRAFDGRTLLELKPLTGRMHQLRVQAAVRGYPVCGDVVYGGTVDFGPPAELPRDRVIGLHARSLTFAHPTTRAAVTVTAPPPDYWGAAVAETAPEN